MLEYIQNLYASLFALVVGVFVFKKLPSAYKVLLLQVLINVTIESIGFFTKGLKAPLYWMYNINVCVEFSLLFMVAFILLEKKYATFFFLGTCIFIIAWCYNFSLGKFGKGLFNIAFSVESFLLVLAYLLVLYQSAIFSKKENLLIPNIFLCLGIIIFFGCNVPYFSLFNKLTKFCNNNEIIFLMNFIKILDSLNYLCIGIAFYFVYKKQKIVSER